jgi:hypothetical protein
MDWETLIGTRRLIISKYLFNSALVVAVRIPVSRRIFSLWMAASEAFQMAQPAFVPMEKADFVQTEAKQSQGHGTVWAVMRWHAIALSGFNTTPPAFFSLVALCASYWLVWNKGQLWQVSSLETRRSGPHMWRANRNNARRGETVMDNTMTQEARIYVNERADNLASAVRYALETTRATAVCPFHANVTIRVGDDAAEGHAYGRASKITKSDGTRWKRDALIKEISRQLGDAADGACPVCASQNS